MLLNYLLFLSSAQASQVIWDGHYRTRAQLFNSLSLSDTNSLAEGLSTEDTHRFRLQPTWAIDHQTKITTQIDILPFTNWGMDSVHYATPSLSEDLFTDSALRHQTLQSNNPLLVQRLWAEHQLEHLWISFGRMPHHWGSGMIFHSGNDPLSEFGNSVDRFAISTTVEDVYIQASADRYEKILMNDSDGAFGGSLMFLYQNESAQGGLYTLLQKEKADEATFSLFTIDLQGSTQTGPLNAEIEVAYQFGKGDLSGGVDDVRVSSVGAYFNLDYQIDRYKIGLGGALAQGDKERNDTKYTRFTFNQDLNVGMLLFEEPLPTLQAISPSAQNEGRDYSAVRTGYSVSNALLIKPTFTATLVDDLDGSLSVLAARAFNLPEDEGSNRNYGVEIDASLKWIPTPHFNLSGTVAYLLPGTYYKNSNSALDGTFNKNVLGMQLLGVASF